MWLCQKVTSTTFSSLCVWWWYRSWSLALLGGRRMLAGYHQTSQECYREVTCAKWLQGPAWCFMGSVLWMMRHQTGDRTSERLKFGLIFIHPKRPYSNLGLPAYENQSGEGSELHRCLYIAGSVWISQSFPDVLLNHRELLCLQAEHSDGGSVHVPWWEEQSFFLLSNRA